MQLSPATIDFGHQTAHLQQASGLQNANTSAPSDAEQVREAFTQFVGETFYGQLLKAMRKSVGKTPYFHGGQAEEIFTSQLDQTLAEQLAHKSTDRFVDPLFQRQFPALAEQLQTAAAAQAADNTLSNRNTEAPN